MTTKSARKPTTDDSIADGLAHALAMSADLYSQVKQAHWTVIGPGFIAVHRLFDEQAQMLSLHVDSYAERMRALQLIPRGTVRETAQASDLPEMEIREMPWDAAVTEILERFETYADLLHELIESAEEAHDPATQDLYTESLRAIDTQSYFLRSYLGDAAM